MTTDEIIAIKAAAHDRGDTETYNLAWMALGYWCTVSFMPATEAERQRALSKLQERNVL